MRKELITKISFKSPTTEYFKKLMTNIQSMYSEKKLKSIVITSALQNEGKSWISANLAITFAKTGKRVIIVDADMRNRSTTLYFQC